MIAESIFPSDVATGWRAPFLGLEAVGIEEQRLVANATKHRQSEFATGRWLAHGLLEQLNLPDGPVLMDRKRAPIWPDGAIGSISHCEDLVIAAVAPSSGYVGLGVDVEPRRDLEADLWPEILVDEELRALAHDPGEPGLKARLLFSAKESVYKACAPADSGVVSQIAIESFRDLSVRLEAPGRFRSLLPGGAEVEGRYAIDSSWIVTAVVRPRGDD